MHAVTLAELKEGDIIRVRHPSNPDEGRLAIIDVITPHGTLKIRLRHRNAGFHFGLQKEISVADVIRVEERI